MFRKPIPLKKTFFCITMVTIYNDSYLYFLRRLCFVISFFCYALSHEIYKSLGTYEKFPRRKHK